MKEFSKSQHKRKKRAKHRRRAITSSESSDSSDDSTTSYSSGSDTNESSSRSEEDNDHGRSSTRKRKQKKWSKKSHKKRRGKMSVHVKESVQSPSQSTIYTQGCKSPQYGVVATNSDTDSQKSGCINLDANSDEFIRGLKTSFEQSTPLAGKRRSRDR